MGRCARGAGWPDASPATSPATRATSTTPAATSVDRTTSFDRRARHRISLDRSERAPGDCRSHPSSHGVHLRDVRPVGDGTVARSRSSPASPPRRVEHVLVRVDTAATGVETSLRPVGAYHETGPSAASCWACDSACTRCPNNGGMRPDRLHPEDDADRRQPGPVSADDLDPADPSARHNHAPPRRSAPSHRHRRHDRGDDRLVLVAPAPHQHHEQRDRGRSPPHPTDPRPGRTAPPARPAAGHDDHAAATARRYLTQRVNRPVHA